MCQSWLSAAHGSLTAGRTYFCFASRGLQGWLLGSPIRLDGMGSALAWAERRREYFRRPPPRPDIANHDELGLTICIVMSAVVSCTSMGAGSEFREHLFLAQIQCHYLPQHAPACCMHSAQGCLFSSSYCGCLFSSEVLQHANSILCCFPCLFAVRIVYMRRTTPLTPFLREH